MEEMSIKEAAKKLDVEAHVLRYWEDELQLDIKRNSLGHRYYDERDIRMFQEVQALKAKGFSLKDIRLGIDRQKRARDTEVERQTDGRPEGGTQEEKQELSSDIEMSENSDINDSNISDSDARDIKIVDFKLAQMQTVMNRIVANALRENKDIITTSIKSEITSDVMRQFDTVMREKEEREEERFRKLDECLRRIQRANEEVAVTKAGRKRWKKR
ncbi:MAG: helix-turn-helix domain-containing protein [Wujia sp.]